MYFPPFRSKHESHGRLGQKGVAQVSRRRRAGGLTRSCGEKVTNVLDLCFEQRGLVQKQPSTPCPPRGPLALYIHMGGVYALRTLLLFPYLVPGGGGGHLRSLECIFEAAK